MHADKIIEAAATVAWLSEQAGSPGEDAPGRAKMTLVLTLTHSYLLEYAAHVSRGMEPYNALMATVRGELKLSDSQGDMLRALIPPAGPLGGT